MAPSPLVGLHTEARSSCAELSCVVFERSMVYLNTHPI
jgi:hypothetical protein